DLPASADVQARAGVLPAPVLRLLRQFRTHLPDGGAARHCEDPELVVLRAPSPLDGEIPPLARIADVLDTGDESGAGSDQPVLLGSMTCVMTCGSRHPDASQGCRGDEKPRPTVHCAVGGCTVQA